MIAGERSWTVMGLPTNSGSLFTGTEIAPEAYRQAGILNVLRAAGLDVRDGGDVGVPDCLPRHNVPPVRNWPSPRVIWDATADAIEKALGDGSRVLLLGGDCSVVVGSTVGLMRATNGSAVHLIVIDGHVDDGEPSAERCVGAAAMGLWFLTTPSTFHADPCVAPESIATIGVSDGDGRNPAIEVHSADQVRAVGAKATIEAALDAIPRDARILVHFDIDVIADADMPAAYSPNPQGLPVATVADLLEAVLADARVAVLEVTEYSGLRDPSGTAARRIVELLGRALSSHLPQP